MVVTAIKTPKVTSHDRDIYKILDSSLPPVSENSVLAIASKIVAICEGRLAKIGEVEKDDLIAQEADYYLPRRENKYSVSLTITEGNLVATAGIDESNGDGYYILWPKNIQKSANEIREYLKKKFSLTNVGVIITDSRTTPLRWGVTGVAIGYSGFKPLHDYIGKNDIFGKKLEFTQGSVIDGLAASAVVTMGEGAEQTPLSIIEDIPFVEFKDHNPTQEELNELKINMEDDLYAPLLTSVNWKKGKG